MAESADNRLAGWLREIDLSPGAERQEAIAKASKSIAGGSLKRADALELALLAYQDDGSSIAGRVIDAVRDQDATAAMRAGDMETSLTAAVATIFGVESGRNPGVLLALAATNATFAGLTPAISDLPAIARRALVVLSESLRSRKTLTASAPEIKSVLAKAGDFSQEGAPVTSEQLRGVIAATEKAAGKVSGVTTRLASAATRRLESTEEELDVLWWCFGEFSELADKPVEALPEHAAAVVLGAELAGRTKKAAPLPSTKALLSRLLGNRVDQPATIGRAIPSALKLVDGALPDVEGHRLLPVLSAAREYRQLEGKPAWKESLSRWAIDPDREVRAVDLAEELVREILLVTHME